MKTILIIDDEPSVRKMLGKLLEKNSYACIEAVNGKQGIQIFKENKPDLVISDLIMPEKEGIETIRELKKLDPDVKIIAISGGGITGPEVYLDLALKLGASKVFSKPVSNTRLISAIKELLF
ncbi:MAG: histidine kinase [Desulfobacterales bacterium RIFOXYA12_FULL_46_15]|nr:MAG: histidine kinase [Desulfobacula sp. GWF2_41_7]OGR26449.1 MAG: histidine kinase [Desulfobacterales bacterium RIFOXYA12_FULL_46_15]